MLHFSEVIYSKNLLKNEYIEFIKLIRSSFVNSIFLVIKHISFNPISKSSLFSSIFIASIPSDISLHTSLIIRSFNSLFFSINLLKLYFSSILSLKIFLFFNIFLYSILSSILPHKKSILVNLFVVWKSFFKWTKSNIKINLNFTKIMSLFFVSTFFM